MSPSTLVHRIGRPNGLRAGVVIGIATALIGAVVGTAMGAETPFQKVVVVNTTASPVPVTGTVNVGNTPTNQNVTVSNFPDTQPVSGTVNVGNFSTPLAAKAYQSGLEHLGQGTPPSTFPFPSTINVSTLVLYNKFNDELELRLVTVAGPSIFLYRGDDTFIQNFNLPVPATGVTVQCFNGLLDCDFRIGAVGP